MSHHFRGSKLAYRFEFSSSSLLPEAHMSVEPGVFATFEMAPVEVRISVMSKSLSMLLSPLLALQPLLKVRRGRSRHSPDG